MARDRGNKTKRRLILAGVPLLIGAIVVMGIFAPKLEGTPPVIELEGIEDYIGVSTCFTIAVSDEGSGLRQVWAGLLAGGKETVLVDETFASSSNAGAVKNFNVCIKPKEMGLADGLATIRIVARDYSWRSWLKGNQTYIEKTITVDTRKPEVAVLSRQHYINQGGSGVVVYRVHEAGIESGVQVGDNFFPGYPGGFDDPDIHLAFFALAYNQGENTPMFVVARDKAGNEAKSGFYHLNKPKQFISENIGISDQFLSTKMPEFDIAGDYPRPVDKFIAINSTLREQNNAEIRSLCANSDATRHWQGRFVRFPNSARRANFADHRSYMYKGQKIGKAVHLGVDLASLAGSSVPAANNGRVAFAGRIGIYGQTVIIDHGMGLFSLYSHLSHIAVEEDQMVSTGDTVGNSGMTGMAGGDHLHFGMLIHDTFVNPVEWWDASWIENNIMSKIKAVAPAEQ